jgi:hypothetical protein
MERGNKRTSRTKEELCFLFVLQLCYMIILQNYAGNKQKSYKIIKMQIFAILDKAKPDAGNIRGLNLGAVKHSTV